MRGGAAFTRKGAPSVRFKAVLGFARFPRFGGFMLVSVIFKVKHIIKWTCLFNVENEDSFVPQMEGSPPHSSAALPDRPS